MRILQYLVAKNFISLRTALRLYPAFLLLGIRVRISEDYRRIRIAVRERWFLRNNNQTVFGGILLLASDPFPALIFEQHFPRTRAWTLEHGIRYLRPARGLLTAEIRIEESDLADLRDQFREKRTAQRSFTYVFMDERGHKVAEVRTVSMVRKERESS